MLLEFMFQQRSSDQWYTKEGLLCLCCNCNRSLVDIRSRLKDLQRARKNLLRIRIPDLQCRNGQDCKFYLSSNRKAVSKSLLQNRRSLGHMCRMESSNLKHRSKNLQDRLCKRSYQLHLGSIQERMGLDSLFPLGSNDQLDKVQTKR